MIEQELPENIADAPELTPPDAENAPKKVRGRPITKENARAMQLSSTQAKRARRETRLKMLAALTHDLNLRDELLKAMKQRDSDYLNMIERATKLVGLQYDQSDEGRAQQLNIKSESKVDAKVAMPSLNVTFVDKKSDDK